MYIKTERLVLEPLSLKYLDSTHEYASDQENTKYMIHLPNETLEETERFLRNVENEWESLEQRVFEYAIILNGKHIGAVSIWIEEDDETGSLGWILHKDYHGKGFATEAAMALRNIALSPDGFNLKKLIAHCDYRNTQSISVMEKLCFTFESDTGVRRYKNSDEDIQELVYSLEITDLGNRAKAETESLFAMFFGSVKTHQRLVDVIISFRDKHGVSHISQQEMSKLTNRSTACISKSISRLNIENLCVELIGPGKYVVHYDNILAQGVFYKILKLLVFCSIDVNFIKETYYMKDKDVASKHNIKLKTVQMFKTYLRDSVKQAMIKHERDSNDI